MRHRLYRLLVCLLLAVCLTGCTVGQTEDSNTSPTAPAAADPTQEDLYSALAGESVLALVLLDPTQEELDLAGGLAALGEPDEYSSAVLILPKQGGSRITVERLSYDGEQDAATVAETAWEDTLTSPGGLLIHTMLPEGMPDLRVTISSGTRTGSYDLSYYGRDNRRDFYILAEDNY